VHREADDEHRRQPDLAGAGRDADGQSLREVVGADGRGDRHADAERGPRALAACCSRGAGVLHGEAVDGAAGQGRRHRATRLKAALERRQAAGAQRKAAAEQEKEPECGAAALLALAPLSQGSSTIRGRSFRAP